MAKNSSNVSFRIQQERTEGTYINMTRFCFRHTSLHHMEQHHRTAALSSSSSSSSFTETMEKRQLNQEKTEGFTLLPSLFPNLVGGSLICAEEVSSTERELTDMSEEEVDLIYRMHRLVGDRWELIAGRIPGRTPEEIKRFWKMKKDPCFAEKGLKRKRAVEGTVNSEPEPEPEVITVSSKFKSRQEKASEICSNDD